MYAYQFCSPSRASLQSGRLPVHVNIDDSPLLAYNPNDTSGGYNGIPPQMTTLATKLRQAGYRTYATGKWDCGMAMPRMTPVGRGYESFLGFFSHANDYYDQTLSVLGTGTVTCNNEYPDFWLDNGPASVLINTAYEEDLFTNYSLTKIWSHDVSEPMFLFHSFHLIHSPLQVPQRALDMFAGVDYWLRKKILAMTWCAWPARGAGLTP